MFLLLQHYARPPMHHLEASRPYLFFPSHNHSNRIAQTWTLYTLTIPYIKCTVPPRCPLHRPGLLWGCYRDHTSRRCTTVSMCGLGKLEVSGQSHSMQTFGCYFEMFCMLFWRCLYDEVASSRQTNSTCFMIAFVFFHLLFSLALLFHMNLFWENCLPSSPCSASEKPGLRHVFYILWLWVISFSFVMYLFVLKSYEQPPDWL